MSTMFVMKWLFSEVHFAFIKSPFPLGVDTADQYNVYDASLPFSYQLTILLFLSFFPESGFVYKIVCSKMGVGEKEHR